MGGTFQMAARLLAPRWVARGPATDLSRRQNAGRARRHAAAAACILLATILVACSQVGDFAEKTAGCQATDVSVLSSDDGTTTDTPPFVFAGPEDMTFDREAGVVYISASPRQQRAEAARARADVLPQGGIYVLRIEDLDRWSGKSLPVRNISRAYSATSDFNPHGISLLIDPESRARTLFVVNHPNVWTLDGGWKDAETTVVRFAVGAAPNQLLQPVLPPVGMGKEACGVNDVVAIDQSRFLVTDSSRDCTLLQQLRGLVTGERSGSILAADHGIVSPLLPRAFLFANGITIRPSDGVLGSRQLFVSDSRAGEVHRYRLATEGALTLEDDGVVLTEAGLVDNLEWDDDARLIVTTHPSMLRFVLYGGCRLSGSACLVQRSPSAVLRVASTPPAIAANDADLLFHDGGGLLSGASVAVVAGNRLLIGSVFDSRLVVCDLAETH